jgi:uncharacterized cupin superfamily protein
MAKDKLEPRRAEPGQEFTYNDADGEVINLRADDEGVVRPKNQAQVRVADAFDLPVARKVIAEKSDAKAASAGKEG